MPVDVVIAGGGAVGSAIAYFLTLQPEFSGSIVVVEPDPTYTFAASTRSAASIRQQFSTPLNIALSSFGIRFLREFERTVASVSLVESTYLYLATVSGAAALRRNVEVQRRSGIDTRLLDRADLLAGYPWINPADIAAASDTAGGEGWFDGYALLRSLRAASERRGVRYVRDRVDAVLMQSSTSVSGVRLGSGDTLRCHWLVNAAGTHSRTLAAQAGIDLPVYPRKRNVFVFESPLSAAGAARSGSGAASLKFPLVVDPSGLWFRPEGDRFICGVVPAHDPDVAPDDFEVDHHLFEELAWPALAHRVPAFEAARVTGAWAGHYDYNTFDQNAFLGVCDAVSNFVLACGFSGHGLQHAPATAKALAEYIACGEYVTIDVTPFSYARYVRNQPLREQNVI